ncbi:hypothetical protein C0J52_15352 [Blattella germanica]|nr:hypothetical protein C0J52_15352 [Blattella germanica]
MVDLIFQFLGNTEVDQPKGIEVVKEGIRKLKFNQQLRKAEGNKTPKVELTISIDGVAIQEPKTKRIMYQYPLHRISYCADDKGEKRFFSFIAKEADSERHICFVFVSDKLSGNGRMKEEGEGRKHACLNRRMYGSPAEEEMASVRQLLAVREGERFLETSGKDLEVQRRLMLLQQKVKRLETENTTLRQRLVDVAQIKGQENGNLLNLSSCSTDSNIVMMSPPISGGLAQPPPVPPRAFEASSGGKAFGENSFISDMLSSSQPSTTRSVGRLVVWDANYETTLAPPPKVSRDSSRRTHTHNNGTPQNSDPFKEDLFGSTPFNPASTSTLSSPPSSNRAAMKLPAAGEILSDPFGMGDFGNNDSADPSQQELENAIGLLDKRLLEMKDGFSRGLSFGNDDFSLESLDPLRN